MPVSATGKRVRVLSRLEVERRRLGWPQAEAAARAGVWRSYWSLLEAGLRPTDRVAGAVAAVLRADPRELFAEVPGAGRSEAMR